MSLDESGGLAEFDGDNLPEKYVAGQRGGAWQQKLLDELYFAFVFQMVTVCIAILLQVPRRYALPRTMRRCGDKRHSDKRRLTT